MKEKFIEVEFTVWQFVRIMVDLEGRRANRPAYEAWQEAWKELDRKLERNRQKDVEAFSDLMMNKEVIVDANLAQVQDAAEAAGRVIRALGKALVRVDSHRERDNLLFEQGELEELRSRLVVIASGMS
jgi:hypothetical protein